MASKSEVSNIDAFQKAHNNLTLLMCNKDYESKNIYTAIIKRTNITCNIS